MELNIEKKNGVQIVHINPKIYSLDVVYTAAYVFLDSAYIVLDGDPEKEILVKIKPKQKDDELGLKFQNELLTYAEYKQNFEDNKDIRQAIMQSALLTNDPMDDYIDDPKGIRIPWEDKYGKTKQ